MSKIILLVIAICVVSRGTVATPGGLGLAGHAYGAYGTLGGRSYGTGAYRASAFFPYSGISTVSRAALHGPAVAYSAGAPYPGAITLPYGVNAGYSHASRLSIASPVYGTVPFGGYRGHGYGNYALGSHH